MSKQTATETAHLRGPVPLSRHFMRSFLRPGDRVVDATCGNGHDTLLMAELVGDSGHAWCFDIQEQALAATRQRLAEAGMEERVTLLLAGHEEMRSHIEPPVKGVFFNLGYLPGSDRSIITRPETTGLALAASLELLAPGGIVAVTVYPGHGGGANERRVVDAWAARLETGAFHAWRMGQLNVMADAPYFILVQRAP